MISTVFLTLLLVYSIQSEICYKLENTDTEAFTYHVCSGTTIREFSDAKEYCSRIEGPNGNQAHLVIFPDEEEFSFLISKLNATEGDNFRFYPGIYQQPKANNRYNPETGQFYWVTDNESQILSDSQSFWQPFYHWIENFDQLPKLETKQVGNFLMDKEGNIYPVVQLGGTLPSEVDDPSIVCMSEGITKLEIGSTKSTTQGQPEDIFELWMIIVIVAGSVFLLILAGVCIGCCISKRRANFHKVPTEEQKVAAPVDYSNQA